ncbi:hypothetical protein UCMB321_5578 [Pseudomonas batumici]|uniref:Uncharacterized protein n=1 Tax=Pseudomonas batumici TaxID=226910 RepID=A0A0C2EQ04_9PSED|nr:hypothetical protein UCMB321_5578 [Pseudomonas batumici]
MDQHFAEVAIGFVHQCSNAELGQLHPHRQGIDKHPEGAVGTRRTLQTPGDYRTEHDIVTSGAAPEHLGPGNMEQHGRRDPGGLRPSADLAAQGRVKAQAGFRHPGPVALDIQHAERRGGLIDIGQAAAEIGFMGLGRGGEDLRDKLPIRLRGWQIAGPALHQVTDFFEHDAQGHVVADHMVVEQGQQPALGVRIAGDAGTHQRCLLQVEAQVPWIAQAFQLGARIFIRRQAEGFHRQLRLAMDHLHRLRLADPVHRAAQDVMAIDDPLQRCDKGVEALAVVELDQRAHQVGVALVTQQVVEEDALLQRCQRVDVLDIGSPAGNGGDDAFQLRGTQLHQWQHVRRQLGAVGRDTVGRGLEQGLAVAADGLGHFPHAGGGEHRAYAGVQAMLAQAVDQADGQQRVTAEFEETVVTTDLFDAQQLLPDTGDNLFYLATRCLVGAAGKGFLAWSGQGQTVELAVGGQGHGFQVHIGTGHHVIRQCLQQGRTQLLDGHRFTAQVGDQALAVGLAGLAFPGDHHSFADTGAGGEHGFDFTQFHTETADLHLVVVAAQVFQGAVRAPAAKVAGPVQAGVRIGGEGVGDKALGTEFGTVEVATGDPDATDMQFPGYTERREVAGGIQHMQLGIAHRCADGAEILVVAFHQADRGVDRGFGRTIGVEQGRAVTLTVEPLGHGLLADGFAADHELAQGARQRHMRIATHLLPEHGGQVGDRDRVLLAQRGKGRGAGDPGIAAQHQGGTGQQRAEDLFHRHVEGHGGELQDAVLRVQAVALLQGADLVAHRTVFEHDAFRLAGGTGGVHHIGQVP